MTEDINHALVAKAHTPMYLMHKFWARKPHNVVREYIEHYSKKGDIVLDPFVGSGVTAIEAIKAGRKGIGIDLNPIAIFIINETTSLIDNEKLKLEFEKIKKECKEVIEEFYKTKCPKCNKKVLIVYAIYDNNRLIEIGYECNECLKSSCTKKRFLIKNPDKYDLDLLKEIEKMKVPYWTPANVKLSYNNNKFLKGEKNDKIGDLFDKRALISLSILYHKIEEIENKLIKNVFKLVFTSNVHNVSKLNTVHQPRWKKGLHPSTSWIVHSYWVPPLRVECPVWFYFEEKYKHILKGKNDFSTEIKYIKEAKNFDDLNNDANIFLKTYNALELTKIIPKNSIDYIFIDPPYGGAVQYFELSTLWASWLKKDMNYSEEITVNKNQNKNFEFYHKMLKAAFREMYQILKTGKYLTVTFHSTDIKIWNSIIKAVVMSGFDLEKIIYQPPARASAKGLFQPYGSAVGDYYIRFKKPVSEKILTEKHMDIASYEREVLWAAKRIIESRGEPTMYQHILNGIMVELKGGRFTPIGARNIEEILKDHIKKEFELIDIKNEKGKVVGKKWWLKDRDFSNFTTPALADRIEREIIVVLDKKVKASFDDILQSIFIDFPNALTPDSQDVKTILEEYAKKTPDGKWMLKPGLGEKDRESLHSRMIYILAILGKRAGYNIWIGSKEQSDIYNKKPLKVLCDDIRCFKNVAQEEIALERVKQIDMLWLEDGNIIYEFEVENTTGISEAIIRGSNISESPHLKRFILIPKQRENFLFKKLQEPILKETIKKVKWNFIRFQDLEIIFKNAKKSFDPVELSKIAKMPKLINAVQKNLFDYKGSE